MHLIPFSILLIRVASYVLPTGSLAISGRDSDDDPEVPKPEERELDGKQYTITPLSDMNQGIDSVAYEIEGGFRVNGEPVPAILKQVSDESGKDDPNSATVKEIGFLKRSTIDLHLFSKWSEADEDGDYKVDIIVKDLRAMDPPLKPFYDWYQEVDLGDIKTEEVLENVYKKVKERLLWYAKKENLLHYHPSMENVFIQKRVITDKAAGTAEELITQIMPINWETAPGINDWGVDDIADKDDKDALIAKYENDLTTQLDGFFAVDELAAVLNRENKKLKAEDYEKVTFQGKEYTILKIRTEYKTVRVYKIVEKFEHPSARKWGKFDALMSIRPLTKEEKAVQRKNVVGGGISVASEVKAEKFDGDPSVTETLYVVHLDKRVEGDRYTIN